MNSRPTDRWLARLSWASLIVCVALFWTAYDRDRRTAGVDAGVVLAYAGAVGCAVLAGLGAKARHRMSRESEARD